MTYFCICNAIKGQEWADTVQEVSLHPPGQTDFRDYATALHKLKWKPGCGGCVRELVAEVRAKRIHKNALVC